MLTFTVRVTSEAGPRLTLTVVAPTQAEALDLARWRALRRWASFGMAAGRVTAVVLP